MAKPKQILTDREKKLILALYAEGKTDLELANVLNIPRVTFLDVLKSNDITDTIKKEVKDIADKQVEKSLFDRAMGYEHPEDKIFCNDGKIIIEPTIKRYPPDTVACIFWLKNRKPEQWKEKSELVIPEGISINVTKNYAKPDEKL